jgi:hypothetical protein
MRWRTLHWTGMPPKPRSCNGSLEKAQRRRPGRCAGSPVRLETHGLPRRGCPYPAGALSFGLSQVGLGLICTALGGIAPRSPCERDPCLAPLGPATGPGQPRTGCSTGDIPLGAAGLPAGQRGSTCRLSYRPGPRLTADIRIGLLQLARTMSLPLPEGPSATKETDDSAHAMSAEPPLPRNYHRTTTPPGPGWPPDHRVTGVKTGPTTSLPKSQNV